MIAVRVCPLVEIGKRRHVIPMTHPVIAAEVAELIGWVAVVEIELDGERYQLLATGK